MTSWASFGVALPMNVVSLKLRKKQYTDEVDLEVLMKQLWCEDLDEIPRFRAQIQLAFLMQLHAFTACRPGAILSTTAYPTLSLQYKVWTFHLPLAPRADSD